MADLSLIKRRKVTAHCLERARQSLAHTYSEPSETKSECLRKFDAYIDSNELELAMNALAEVGVNSVCRGAFWRDLERAALLMDLHDRATEFRLRFIESIKCR